MKKMEILIFLLNVYNCVPINLALELNLNNNCTYYTKMFIIIMIYFR